MSALEFDSDGIQELGTQTGSLAEELQKIHGTWAKATGTPGDAFGLAELEGAYMSMQGAWDQELNVYTTVLGQVGGNVQTSGANYGSAETTGERNAQRIDGPR
jgi:uncharacterized protein YukE